MNPVPQARLSICMQRELVLLGKLMDGAPDGPRDNDVPLPVTSDQELFFGLSLSFAHCSPF